MKKLLLLFLASNVYAQEAARVLTGSAQPPLPFNIIPNAGFEDRTTGWAAGSGSTFTTSDIFANVGRGRFSGSLTIPISASSGVTLSSKDTLIPAGLFGRSCVGAILYKGAAATNGTMVIEAYDGTLTYGTKVMPDATNYSRVQTTAFTCPSSGNLRLRIRTTASGPAAPTALYFDEAFLGDFDSFGGSGGGSFAVTSSVTVNSGGTITVGPEPRSLVYIQGNAAPVTASSGTTITAGATNGQELTLMGLSNTNTVTIDDGGNVLLNGSIEMAAGDSLGLVWDTVTTKWIEVYRK